MQRTRRLLGPECKYRVFGSAKGSQADRDSLPVITQNFILLLFEFQIKIVKRNKIKISNWSGFVKNMSHDTNFAITPCCNFPQNNTGRMQNNVSAYYK